MKHSVAGDALKQQGNRWKEAAYAADADVKIAEDEVARLTTVLRQKRQREVGSFAPTGSRECLDYESFRAMGAADESNACARERREAREMPEWLRTRCSLEVKTMASSSRIAGCSACGVND